METSLFTFRHLGVAVESLDRAIPVYRELFGYQLVSGPYDDPLQKVSVCFLGREAPGDIVIELVAPLGDESPVRATLAKGGSAYHVCYEVPDIEKALDELRTKGCIIISKPVPAVAFNQRRIAWLYTPTRQLIEALEK
ncbi:MAG TPA: VOC family protein [Bryobacteraceae bacterium]|nr:VOC family protein [Bryobacteraceae bacterium]